MKITAINAEVPGALATAAASAAVQSSPGLPPRRAQVLAFVASKGGSGATFMAVNLGHVLASRGTPGTKVLLIDLNLQLGAASWLVRDSPPSHDMAEVARNITRLDASFLDASLQHVTPNFSILAAPENPAHALQVKVAHLDAILDLAVTQFDFILLDVNVPLDELKLRALDRSKHIFLVTQAMVPAVRNTHRLLAMFASLGYARDKVQVVLNRYAKRQGNGHDIGLDELHRVLGEQPFFTVPNGFKEVAQAINLGEPLAQVDAASPVYRALCELAQSLQPLDTKSGATWLHRIWRRAAL